MSNNEQAAQCWATILSSTTIHHWVGQRNQDDWDNYPEEDMQGTTVELMGPALQMNFIHELAHDLGLLSMTLEWDDYTGNENTISACLFLSCSETDLSIWL